MRIHRDTTYLTDADRGTSAAIGNFDGVHLGHQAVLRIAAEAADAPLAVVTFEPHPREYFAPDAPPFRLMNAEARANRRDPFFNIPAGGADICNIPVPVRRSRK